jgi:ABC-2 type transport system permease protein
MLRFMLEKEFKQLVRHPFLPKLCLVFPCIMLLVMPWAASFEVRDVRVCLVDSDRSPLSERLAQKVAASRFFHLVCTAASHGEALAEVERNAADLILEVEAGFERHLMREGHAGVFIAANAVNSAKGGLGAAYLQSVINDYVRELNEELQPAPAAASADAALLVPHFLFNPRMDYKVFMVPALIVMLLTLLCGFLPALNIVSEKELGTIEQLNVTPVSRLSFIIAKLVLYWTVGFVTLTIAIVSAALLYRITPASSLARLWRSLLSTFWRCRGWGWSSPTTPAQCNRRCLSSSFSCWYSSC